MNVSCPDCQTVYRVDPRKVPTAGVRARCSHCGGVFAIPAPERETAGAAIGPASAPHEASGSPVAGPAPAAGTASEAPSVPTAAGTPSEAPSVPSAPAAPPTFGASDPEAKARRLARALVSDIVVYHPDRRARALAAGTLRQEFREEIQKSWEEYVSQVGAGLARATPHFRNALNDLLAGGDRIF